MKYIVLIAVAAVVLLQWSGAVPNSSVGGPMTMALAFLAAALVFGAYEAWSKRRGVLGWIVSIVAALVGAVLAGMLGGTVMDIVMGPLASLFNIQGSLAETRHPLLYVTSAAMMLITLAGSCLALQIVNRLR